MDKKKSQEQPVYVIKQWKSRNGNYQNMQEEEQQMDKSDRPRNN